MIGVYRNLKVDYAADGAYILRDCFIVTKYVIQNHNFSSPLFKLELFVGGTRRIHGTTLVITTIRLLIGRILS